MAIKRYATDGAADPDNVPKGFGDEQVVIDGVARLLAFLAQPCLIEQKYQRILSDLVFATEADSASLRIRDESDGSLQRVAYVEKHGNAAQAVPVGPLDVSGADHGPDEDHSSAGSTNHSPDEDTSSAGSTVTQPITVGGQVVGVLLLESADEDHFTPGKIRLLGVIGNVVGLTLQHGKIWRHLQSSLDELAVLDEIARIITSTLNIDEVYERFTVELQKLVQFDRINIKLVDT